MKTHEHVLKTSKSLKKIQILCIFQPLREGDADFGHFRYCVFLLKKYSKAFSEIRVFLSILGGKDDTLFLACGFGDLCMTSLHDLSRNRTLGLLVGKGFFNSDYKSNAVILEGLNSIKILHDLLDENQMKRLPIFSKVYSYFTNPDDSKIDFYYSEFIDYNK